jgi:hypothetical protein
LRPPRALSIALSEQSAEFFLSKPRLFDDRVKHRNREIAGMTRDRDANDGFRVVFFKLCVTAGLALNMKIQLAEVRE